MKESRGLLQSIVRADATISIRAGASGAKL